MRRSVTRNSLLTCWSSRSVARRRIRAGSVSGAPGCASSFTATESGQCGRIQLRWRLGASPGQDHSRGLAQEVVKARAGRLTSAIRLSSELVLYTGGSCAAP